jgi:hypothetical protein
MDGKKAELKKEAKKYQHTPSSQPVSSILKTLLYRVGTEICAFTSHWILYDQCKMTGKSNLSMKSS